MSAVRWSGGRRSVTSSTTTSTFHGGHIGYGVRPAWRRRGYATEILRQSLVILRSYGVEHVLVTCDDANLGSAAVIEACGGVLERIVPGEESDDGVPFRRYWID